MARRALFLAILVTMTAGCPDLTRSDRRPQHRAGDDNAEAPKAAPKPIDDGVDQPAPGPAVRPAAPPAGAAGPAAPNPLKLRPGLRPNRPIPRQPLRARPVPGGLPTRPAPSDRPGVAPDGTVR